MWYNITDRYKMEVLRMKYCSVSEIAIQWGISERAVRKYCAEGRVAGAILKGKTWLVPENAVKPVRKKREDAKPKTLLDILAEEKSAKLHGGIYHKLQIELTYNSNHMEGSRLTHDQTRYIYETNTIGITDQTVRVDDVIETANHFRCIDHIIDKANASITESLMKQLHFILKNGTSDSRLDWFAVGDYKRLPNEVGGQETTPPELVASEIRKLLEWYNSIEVKNFKDILEFHYQFECIHPFQDGNGRVGRLLLFKECLKHNIVPFVIDEQLKLYYYRGLKEWKKEPGFLTETCYAAQDKFKAWLCYFKIHY